MVNIMNAKILKLLTKYSLLLILYILIQRFLYPYGLNLYYTLTSNPDMQVESVNIIQGIISASSFILSLILVIFIIIDSKQKKALDWIIALITFFAVETGIILFLIWQIYKEVSKKYEA